MRLKSLLILFFALGPAACAGSGGTTRAEPKEPAPIPEEILEKEKEAGLTDDRSTDSFTDKRPIPKVSQADADAFGRVWELYRRGDPRWPLERDRYRERSEGAAYLLAANLLRHYMKINEHRTGNAKALAAVKREISSVGRVAAPNLVDLMILDRIPMRDDRWFIPDDITRKDCQEMLEGMGRQATPSLLRALRREDLGIKGRRLLAQTLGGTGDSRVFEPLVGMLRNDESWQVRADAASALGELADQRAIVPLTEAIKTDKDEFVVRQAGRAKLQILEPFKKRNG